jgi:hypothetical protein
LAGCLGQSRVLEPLVRATSIPPARAREKLVALNGALEGVSPRRLGSVDGEAVAAWIAAQYPERRYPAVAIGSSNGALPHLAAAFDMPWLPQTFLTLVRHLGNDPDRPKDGHLQAVATRRPCSKPTPTCNSTTSSTRTRTG